MGPTLKSAAMCTDILFVFHEFYGDLSDICESLEFCLAEALVHLHKSHEVIGHFVYNDIIRGIDRSQNTRRSSVWNWHVDPVHFRNRQVYEEL